MSENNNKSKGCLYYALTALVIVVILSILAPLAFYLFTYFYVHCVL